MSALARIAARLQITRPLICLDLETTGTVLGLDRIIQIGVQKVTPELSVTEWSTFVDPQLPIPAEATITHKITNDMVAGAPSFGDLSPRLAAGLSGCDFVGYNVKFDLRFLEAEFARVGVKWSYEDASILDGLRIWQVQDPRDLSAAVQRFLAEDHTGAHDALADVRATAGVVDAMLAHWPNLPSTVDGFHALLFARDPRWVDATGKIVWRNSDACLGFGKYNGWTLQRIVAADRRYCETFLLEKGNFPDDVKAIVRDALAQKFPVRALQEAA